MHASSLRKHLPTSCKKVLLAVYDWYCWKFYYKYLNQCHQRMISEAPARNADALKQIRSLKRPIRIAFFVLFENTYKYGNLPLYLQNDKRFEPFFVICPVVNYGYKDMLERMEKAYSWAKDNWNMKIIKGFDSKTGKYIDLKKVFSPDLIFFTSPYEAQNHKKFHISYFKNTLSCYLQYGFTVGNCPNINFQEVMHNAVWKYYVDTKIAMEDGRRFSYNKGINFYHAGYPACDCYLTPNPKTNPWKIKDPKLKRVIWAPHHTINNAENLYFSNFLRYANFMTELAKRYIGKVQFIFNPHPVLQNKLDEMWGEDKRKDYYAIWENMPNSSLLTGPYQDMFMTSDAIIHDCGSFIAEYLYTGKPCLYCTNKFPIEDNYSKLGQECLRHYYLAADEKEISDFIDMVLREEDSKSTDRRKFVNENLLPPNGKTASQNIYEDLCHEFFGSN